MNTPFSPERWTHEAKRWLEDRLRQHIEDMRVYKGNPFEWFREILGDPKSVDSIVAWYSERPRVCVRWHDDDTFDPEIGDGQGEWTYETQQVEDTIFGVVELCRVAALEPQSLDDWLQAERDGMLEGAAPKEPHADTVLELLGCEMELAAHRRRRQWPRSCRTCGAEFRTGKGRECHPCRIRRLQATTSWCKPTPCRGCGKKFMPNTWNAAYCSHECHRSYVEKKRRAVQ